MRASAPSVPSLRCRLVADIHFNHKLAIGAVEAGAAKLRINPGNIGDWAKVDAVIDAAGASGCAIRIGVNAGSLEQDIARARRPHAARKARDVERALRQAL